MAKRVKVGELRTVLEAFAKLYEGCGSTDRSRALQNLSAVLQPISKQDVDKLVDEIRVQSSHLKKH